MFYKKIFIVFFIVFSFNANAKIIDGIAAVVNNEIIFLSELKSHIEKSGIKSNAKSIQRKYLKELTDLKLLELQGKRMGITLTQDQLDKIEENFIKKNTKEKIDSELARTGTNLYRIRFGWKNQYLQESIAAIILRSKIVISNNEIEEFYLKNYGPMKEENLADLFLIVLKSNKQSTNKIKEFQENLKDTKEFNTSIAEFINNGSFLSESKDLGYISINEINKKISDSVIQSDTGRLVGPFVEEDKTKYFYIKDKATGDSQFYNIKKEIRKKIIDQKEFKVLDDWFNDLRENAYISIRI